MDNPSEPTSLDVGGAAAAFTSLLGPAEGDPKKPDDTGATAKDAPAEGEVSAAAVEAAGDPPAPEMVEVEIDGFKIQLPKDKAEKLESERLMHADYTRKTMKAADERKAAEAEQAKTRAERAQYAQHLAGIQLQMQAALQEQSKSVNWAELLETNPAEYLKQQHLANARQAALNQAGQELGRLQQAHQAEQQEAQKAYVRAQQDELLAKLPEWKDDAKRKADTTALREYVLNQGYTPEWLDNLTDAKAVVILRKAMLYDEARSKAALAAKKVATLPTKVLQPGGGEAPNLDRRTAAFQRLSKSGSVEDAGALFASLI